MNQIVYVPLEHLDSRYTSHLDSDITSYLHTRPGKLIKINPPFVSMPPNLGEFLNAGSTIEYKAMQLRDISTLYQVGLITDQTQFFFSDLWFPGIESIAYLNYFYKVKPLITGIIHAGSFTDTDFVRGMERWAVPFESIIFDICDRVYCGSEFIKEDILKKRICDSRKLIVTGFPYDSKLIEYDTSKKEDIVIFNGRMCEEKQPWLFNELYQELSGIGWKFISTQQERLNKHQYYKLLAKSKIVVSFALQENFGFGIAEAVALGCVPVLPNRLAYKDLYDPCYLYSNFADCIRLTAAAMQGTFKAPQPPYFTGFKNWFL